jgi:hypothetical protein
MAMGRRAKRRTGRAFTFEPLEGRRLMATGRAPDIAAASPPDAAYVDALGALLADRPLPAGLGRDLLDHLAEGGGRRAAVRRALDHPSVRRAMAHHAFKVLLDRDPTAAELRRGARRLAGRGDQRDLFAALLGTSEYLRGPGGGTRPGLVAATYRDLLGRAPEPLESQLWTRSLRAGGPAARSRLIRTLLASDEFNDALAARLARVGDPFGADPTLAERLRTQLDRPGGLDAALAHAYATPAFYRRATLGSAPAPNPPRQPVSAVNDHPPGLPLPPGIGLTTAWNPIADVSLFSVQALGAAPDGSLWAATNTALLRYNAATAAWDTFWDGFAASVAPLSNAEVWAIVGTVPGAPTSVARVIAGLATPVAALPGGDAPQQVAAAPGAPVWVLGQSGTLYQLGAGDTWSVVPVPAGVTLTQLAVGSASNRWAIGTQQGNPAVFQYVDGQGFVADADFSGITATAIGAAADGSTWVAAGTVVFFRTALVDWALVPNQTPPGPVELIAPVSSYRLLAYTLPTDEDLSPTQVLSVGLTDQPAVPFPAMNPGQSAGYEAISQAVGATGPDGIRGQYTNLAAPISDYFATVTAMSRPAHVDPADWTIIRDQVLSELQYVTSVNNLFTQLEDLRLSLATLSAQILPAVGTDVGLTTQENGPDTVELVLSGMIQAAIWGIAAAGLPIGGAVAASVLASVAGSVLGAVLGNPNPDSNTAVEVAYVNLSDTMASFYTGIKTSNAAAQQSALSDWGQLSTLGRLIDSGQWTWTPDEGAQLAAGAQTALSVYFYQALMPVKWEIVYYYEYLCDIYSCPTVNVPNYDIYSVVIEQGQDTVLENLWFMHEAGKSRNPFGSPGPFPVQSLIQNILNLGVSMADLYTGQNGWTIPIVDATFG